MNERALELALLEARLRRELPSPAVRRLIRERAGVSQRRLALALGVSHSTLRRWETGTMTPRGNNLARYVCALAYVGHAAGLGTASPAVNGAIVSAIRPEQRFTKAHPCPICRGHGQLARGGERGGGSLGPRRCWGFLSEDGNWAHCTREEHAGDLEQNGSSRTFAHKMYGSCKCGATHGELAEEMAGDGSTRGGAAEAVY